MKRTNIIYWIFTGLLSLFIFPGAIFNMLSSAESLEIFRGLGYPDYVAPFVGTAKAIGIIAILVPGYPLIKEWAYAGLFYDLLGAAYSGICAGTPILNVSPIFIGIAFVFGSYIYYHKRLKEKSQAA